ncbi:hypothetical protein Neosp_015110 [[Neocosmospora] mangrovei]
MPIPLHNLTPEERRIFDLICSGRPWKEISRDDQDAIRVLDAKYPDLVKSSIKTPGGSVASSSLPLSQMSELPETPSQLSRPRLWEAYNKTQDIWKGQLAEPPPVPLPHPGIARASQPTPRVQPPMSPYPREAQPAPSPSQFYLTSSPAAAEASVPISPSSPGYRRPPPPTPLSPYPYPHEQANVAPATPSQQGPASVPGPSQQQPPAPSQKPSSHESEKIQLLTRIADRRAWLTQKRNDSTERYRASLHDAVNAETEVTKLTNELQELAIQEQQIRNNTHLSQETPKTSSYKRRERKKRAQEKQGSFENVEDSYDDF